MAKSKDTTLDPLTGEIEVPSELSAADAPTKRHEVLGVLCALVALFLLLSLLSYDGLAADGTVIRSGNLIGPAGMWTAYFTFTLLGAAIYLVDAFTWIWAVCLFTGRGTRVRPRSVLGVLIAGFLASVALHTLLHDQVILGGHTAGGFLGELFGEILISLVSTTGTYIVTLGGIVVVLLLVTDISLFLAARLLGRLVLAGARRLGRLLARIVHAWRHGPAPTADAEPGGPTVVAVPAPDDPNADGPEVAEPVIVKPDKKKKKKKKKKAKPGEAAEPLVIEQTAMGDFQLPSLDLLSDPPAEKTIEVDEAYLQEMAQRLTAVLADFGVVGDVREIHPGPVVTMFELQPRSGTKLSKIGNLSAELAMTLEVNKVRVVAPIPGKNAVGFELPNKKRATVWLKEMLTDRSFERARGKLPLALGREISGEPYVADLARMPHVLVAGTTGSGKSVALNTMLLSLLYRYTPEELRLLLIDPKMIELGMYDRIPHLLLPVVTDMSKACLALKWAVDEMERRYQLFADLGVRNLASYNRRVEKLIAEGTTETEKHGRLEKLPLIVTAIDELADLMMTAAKDVETSVTRLAQKARAAGLHLIVSTQRPSTDVITGLIKANFPVRMSFRVSQGVDSRTILGTNGAENLLGRGDSLIIPPGSSDLKRIHGAFVEEEDIRGVIEFLRAQGQPVYDEEILKAREDEGSGDIDDSDKDEVYDQAVAIVAEARACSISMIQRRLRIGYNRAARIVELMEKEGVVGPANGVNKREVLVSSHL
jgi:S-DNA-T family DNA segregation ATPase FtsK/SpoIIIE